MKPNGILTSEFISQMSYNNRGVMTIKKRGISVKKAKEIREEKGLDETNLQRIRTKKGLSQSALAEKSGVTKRMIECYEQKTRSIDNASLERLCALSAVLGCKIEDLLESKRLLAVYRKVK